MKLFNVVAAALLACACATDGGLRGANTDTLKAGESLKAGEQLTSGCGGIIKFVVQGDGNLVVYQTNTGASNDAVLWASNTHTATGDGLHLDLQGDGNLVLYSDPQPHPVVWATNTNSATELVAQCDCNAVLRDSAGKALWATNTEAHNLVAFEPNLRGRFSDNRVTRIDLMT